MNRKSERQAFLEALLKDRYDQTTRLVYADWLEEHGDDLDYEEAVKQREWTPEWQKSVDWLTDFAASCGETCVSGYGSGRWDRETESIIGDEEKYVPITFGDVIRAGHDCANNPDGWGGFVKVGDELVLNIFHGETRRLFWEHWEVVTKSKLTEEQKNRSAFGCTC